MNMTIHCPGCRVSLHVPQEAVGRIARCPRCRRKFAVPSPNDVLEDQVSRWIVEDLEHDREEKESVGATGDTLMGVVAEQPTRAATKEPARTAAARSATDAPEAPDPAERPESPTAMGAVHDDDEPARAVDRPNEPAPAAQSEPIATAHRQPAATAPMRTDHRPRTSYPCDLHHFGPQPRLIVRDCAQNGVVLAFEPRWLEHGGFGASMPVRCAFSGVSTRADLIARPMIFLDRYRGADRAVHLIEKQYERPAHTATHPRELLDAMGQLDNMVPPFQHVLIYYVSKHHATQWLQGQIATAADGTSLCEVTIPDGRVALDWLGHVNGICGEDYELLRNDVTMLGSEAWRALTEKCRERLGIWCRFQAREQFRHYINDADFGSHDAGLAGVVITDQRLIYHKYHHGGSVDLMHEATLHVKTDGQVARLTYDCKGRLARIGKIQIKDMSRLIEMLAAAPSLRIQLAAATAKS